MQANIISKIIYSDPELKKTYATSGLETSGDFFMSPFRELFGHTFHLVSTKKSVRLNKYETTPTVSSMASKVAAAVLLPFTLLLTLVALTLKGLSRLETNVKDKYYLPVFIKVRKKLTLN